ncbi:MAG TPA: hybrid sensor histidine kinase/response regulator [Polyangiaceae bacterium]|jgi:signal transduction histidine kinase
MNAPVVAAPQGAVKFLLVDDREENLFALEALLRREGLEILTARSGTEALELLLTHDVALALLDVEMPEMDGFALAELMRGSARTRHVPIIFVTANPFEQRRVFQGYDAGAVDFLIKPLEPQVLRHKTATFFELHRQRQAIAEMLRLNETFVAAVGHDLRNPLNAVLFSADLLARNSPDADAKRAGERIRSSALRMARIIDDLFDLARARLGHGLPIDRKRADPRAIVERIVVEQQVASRGRSITLTAEPCPEGEWDPTRIEQVVSNLVGNAVRHGDPEEPVSVDVAPRDDGVCITVHNGGCIPADLVPRIFMPFVLRDGHSNDGGLGMGLYIVEQIVLAHRGRVDVRSTPQEGTTFSVQLPLRP